MTDLILDCGTYNFIIDASESDVTINSLGPVTINNTGLFVVSGAVNMSSFGAGFVQFDASGNLSSAPGSFFNVAGSYTLTGAWTFSNTVQVNSTFGVTGAVSLGGNVSLTSLATRAPSLGIPSISPPSGYYYVIVKGDTGQLYKMF